MSSQPRLRYIKSNIWFSFSRTGKIKLLYKCAEKSYKITFTTITKFVLFYIIRKPHRNLSGYVLSGCSIADYVLSGCSIADYFFS